MADIDRVRFVTTRDFLDNILPVDQSTLDRIYRTVLQHKSKPYVNQRWSGFPKGKYKEEYLYKPFVNIANVIAQIAGKEVPKTEDQVKEASWKDYHSESPQSLEPDATRIRPDCALAMAMASDADLKNSPLPEARKETLWWLQFVAVVEAKRDFDQNNVELIRQLLGYLRLVMVEQKDRRFALGLFLSGSQASVWLHDRSGVIGMDVPISMHEKPMDFVHVIAAMSILPAHRLGFDPDMQLAREPSPPIHTYRLSSAGPDKFDIELYKKSHYATQWVIKTKGGTFMTLRAMSLLRTDIVMGSGCMVWAAIRYNDRHQDLNDRKVFVLKQWWKSEGQADEGAIYERLGAISAASGHPDAQYLGQLECHEIVKIGGEVDSTDSLIQRRLKDAPPLPREHAAGIKRPHTTDPELDETFHINFVTEDDLDVVASYAPGANAKALQKRTRMRVVLKTFGCPIKFFTTRQELLTCLLHAVRGHRFAYDNGYVQRDVSTANLLIALSYQGISLRGRFPDVRGCLIDFDHAKEVLPVAQRKAELELRDDPRLYTFFRDGLHPELAKRITKEVFQRALQLVKFRAPEATRSLLVACSEAYIEAALQYHEISGRSSLPNNPYTPEQLGWNSDLLHPAVDIHQDRDGRRSPRSGTPPYASAKILNEDPVEVPRWLASGALRPSVVVHDAIHDMESFFWVLLHLCMTRSGPGGARREELVGELNPDTDSADVLELRRIVYCFFDGPLEIIAWNKKEVFKDWKNFEPLVLRHIHPYFEPLRSLLRRWWELLLLAYEFEGYEYHNIHTFVIELVERALKELGTIASPDDEQRQEDATERRNDFFRRIIYADRGIPTQQAQQASAPSSPNEYRVTTAFNTTPEAQRQKPATDARNVPSPPSSPTPVQKKTRKSKQ